MSFIPLYTPRTENTIKYTLNNLDASFKKLKERLVQPDLKEFEFNLNINLGNYRFDFYSSKLNFAIQIDTYMYDDTFNADEIKLVNIAHKGIKVLKVSDYQVFIDLDEIIRFLKNTLIKNKMQLIN